MPIYFQTSPLRLWVFVLTCGPFALTCLPVNAKPAPKRKQQPASEYGVDTGIVNTPTTLFTEPHTSAEKIGPLRQGALTVLVSREKANGWLNVIQFTSGRQGWVKSERLTIRYTKRPTRGFDFRAELLGTNELPVVEVSNTSSKGLFVHLGATPEFYVGPKSTKSVSVPAGAYSYNAASPGVIPAFGTAAFLTGGKYTWSFFIRSSTGPNPRKTANPALVAEMNRRQKEADAEAVEVRLLKQQIEVDRTALDMQRESWKKRSDELDARRLTLDQSDEAAVDAFNNLVDSVNADLARIREAQQRFNSLVDAYNSKVEALNAKREYIETLADQINRD